MASTGYNIPISASLSAGSAATSPFDDETFIAFPGSTLESNPNTSITPTQDTSATASASNGGPASAVSGTGTGTPAVTGAASSATSALSGLPVYLIVGGVALVAIIVLRHHGMLKK